VELSPIDPIQEFLTSAVTPLVRIPRGDEYVSVDQNVETTHASSSVEFRLQFLY